MLRSGLRSSKVIYLFSLLFILAIGITVFHYHEDGSLHPDCLICAMAVGVYSCEITQDTSGIVIHQNVSHIYSCEEVINKFWSFFPVFASRAPPLASLS